ncbi:HU family DNA-binding protein [Riemerella anatipestifer]|nr:HU family DNA-binding protein [Riemerella anatipestifer]
MSFKNLSKELSEMSTTVSDTDALAVLNDLTKLLSRHLSEGRIVRLGEFGSFQVSLSSNGEEEEAKVTAASVKNAKIQFRPGEDLKAMLKTAKFEKYTKK